MRFQVGDAMQAPRQDGTGRFSPFDLQVEPFKENQDVRKFTCGNKDLDDFLTTDEVTNYEKEGLGKTYLVYHKENLVAYYTVSNDSLRWEYLKPAKSRSKSPKLIVDSFPAGSSYRSSLVYLNVPKAAEDTLKKIGMKNLLKEETRLKDV